MSRFINYFTNDAISFWKLNFFVKFFLLVIFFGHFISYFSSVAEIFSIFPGKLLPPNLWIWTLFTYSFIEHNLLLVACNVAVVFMFARVVEPLWGSLEILKFYGIITTSVAFITTFTYFVMYFVEGDTDLLFNTPIYGMSGYAAGLTVVIKQTMGDQLLFNVQFVKIRNKHIPLLAMTIMVLLRLVRFLPSPQIFLFFYGLLVSWVYLRFYQKHSDQTRGDSAVGFSFANFFPEPISFYVSVISSPLFTFFVSINFCPPQQKRMEQKSSVLPLVFPTESHDAERRRQLALKALNERLNKVSSIPWPNLEEDENPTVFKNSALLENKTINNQQKPKTEPSKHKQETSNCLAPMNSIDNANLDTENIDDKNENNK